MRIVIALLFVASLLPQTTLSASAAEPLTMSIRPGFDGLARVGLWLPIAIEVANRGPDISGELEVHVQGTTDRGTFNTPPTIHRTAVVLPRYSDKRFYFEVFIPSIANRVTARLKSNDNVLLERDVALETVPSGELLCGTITRNNAALDFISTIPLSARQRNARIARLDPSDIPSRPQTLATIDCLVMGPANGSLGERQMAAIESWVSGGGMLIVVGGQNWQKTIASLPADLLPVKITGMATLDSLAELAKFGQQPIAAEGPWLASRGTVSDGNALVQQGDIPLLVAAKRGAGVVFYLALDPAAEPLLSWQGSERLWRYILSNASMAAASPNAGTRQYSGWGRVPAKALGDLSDTHAPDGRPLLLIVSVYFVLLVPVSYFALHRFGRAHLSFIVAIGLILGTSFVSFAFANANRYPDVMVNTITVVRAWDGSSPALTRSYVSHFSPQGFRSDLVGTGDTLFQSLYHPFPYKIVRDSRDWSLEVLHDGNPFVRGYVVPAGSMATITVDGLAESTPITSDIVVNDDHVTGRVTNNSDKTLENAAVVFGREVVPLGTLVPEQSREIDFFLTKEPPAGYLDIDGVIQEFLRTNGAGIQEKDVRHDIVTSALNTSYSSNARVDLSAVTLIAWLTDSPLRLRVAQGKPAVAENTLLVETLPLRFAPGLSTQVPQELIERRPMSSNAGGKLEEGDLTLSTGDSASTEYALPAQLGRFEVTYLALNLEGKINDRDDALVANAIGNASVFDWHKLDWTDIKLHFGENPLLEPQRFVSPLGTVRVRYTFRPSGDPNVNRFDIEKFDVLIKGQGQ